MSLRPARRLIVSLAVLSLFVTVRPARADSPVPTDLAAFASSVQTLLDGGRTDDLKSLAADPAVLSWLGGRARRAVHWHSAALDLPSAGSAPRSYVLVFSDFHTCESIGDHVHKVSRTAQGWRIGPEISERDTRGFRVRDHQLRVMLDLAKSGCSITDEVTIERIGTRNTPCLLRLSSDMKVSSILLGDRPMPYRAVPGIIAFIAPPQRTFTLRMAYAGTVNHPGSDYIRNSEVVLCSYWYPHIARLPAKHGVTVTVPKGWTAVGEGELVSRAEGSAGVAFRFRNNIPTCYFTLDAGPYKITSRVVDGRRLSVYELRQAPGRADRALESLSKCLSWYSSNFSRYPYTHYEVVETMGPFDGALEAYSFSTYNRGGFGAIPHEVSHTWWGGTVPCPYTTSMWNESFASYSPDLWQRETGSVHVQKASRGLHAAPNFDRGLPRSYAKPMSMAFDTSNGADSAVGYGKGADVLAMLEDLLGTDTMLRAMRAFIAGLHPGDAADWPDFARAVRKVTGTDYGWFFDQWVDRGGVPVIKIADVQRTKAGDAWSVSGRVVQEGEPYRLRMPVAVDLEGSTTVRRFVEVTGASTRFSFQVSGKPTVVHLDPDGSILMAGGQSADDPFTARIEDQPPVGAAVR